MRCIARSSTAPAASACTRRTTSRRASSSRTSLRNPDPTVEAGGRSSRPPAPVCVTTVHLHDANDTDHRTTGRRSRVFRSSQMRTTTSWTSVRASSSYPAALRPSSNPEDTAADTASERTLVVRAHTWAAHGCSEQLFCIDYRQSRIMHSIVLVHQQRSAPLVKAGRSSSRRASLDTVLGMSSPRRHVACTRIEARGGDVSLAQFSDMPRRHHA